MDTYIDSHYNHHKYGTGPDDDPPVVDQLPVTTSVCELLSNDVVNEDDSEEGAIMMDVFSVDEGETVVTKRFIRLKQQLKHMLSVLQVLLNLLT